MAEPVSLTLGAIAAALVVEAAKMIAIAFARMVTPAPARQSRTTGPNNRCSVSQRSKRGEDRAKKNAASNVGPGEWDERHHDPHRCDRKAQHPQDGDVTRPTSMESKPAVRSATRYLLSREA